MLFMDTHLYSTEKGVLMEKKRMFILIIAVIGMIGAFLPWYTVFGTMNVSGTEDGGWLTLILFAAGGAIAFFAGDKMEPLAKKFLSGVWIPAAIAFLLILTKIFRSRPGLSLSIGVWVVALAALAQIFVTFFYKGAAGWDMPKSMADVTKAAGIPAPDKEPEVAEPAAPAAPVTPVTPVTPVAPVTPEAPVITPEVPETPEAPGEKPVEPRPYE